MQQGRERCGLIGRFIKNQHGKIVFIVESHIDTQKDSEGRTRSLPVEFDVGEEIPIEQIVVDHRGIVIYDDGFIREGEIDQKENGYVLASDYDDGLDIALEGIVDLGLRVELKPEIHDPEGAAKRLRFSKLRLGGFFGEGLE